MMRGQSAWHTIIQHGKGQHVVVISCRDQPGRYGLLLDQCSPAIRVVCVVHKHPFRFMACLRLRLCRGLSCILGHQHQSWPPLLFPCRRHRLWFLCALICRLSHLRRPFGLHPENCLWPVAQAFHASCQTLVAAGFGGIAAKPLTPARVTRTASTAAGSLGRAACVNLPRGGALIWGRRHCGVVGFVEFAAMLAWQIPGTGDEDFR